MIGSSNRQASAVAGQSRAISRGRRGIADAHVPAMKTLDRAQLAKILGGAGNSPTSTPDPDPAAAIAGSRMLPKPLILPRF